MAFSIPKNAFFVLVLCSAALANAQEASSKSAVAVEDETVQYLRADGIIYGLLATDSAGIMLRRESYLRDSEGRIVQILLQYPDGKTECLVISGRREWIEYPDESRVLKIYNLNGSLQLEERRAGDLVLSRYTYAYQGEPPRVVLVREERPPEGSLRTTEYDSEGLLHIEKQVQADGSTETLKYAYDGQGRLVEIHRTSSRNSTRVQYFYGEDGSRTEESFDSTGAIVLRTLENADGTSVEEHFDGGNLFARLYRKDGRVYREEILSGGIIVRVREAP